MHKAFRWSSDQSPGETPIKSAASMNSEEVEQGISVGLCNCSGGWRKLVYPAGSIAAVRKERGVYGDSEVSSARSNFVELTVCQLYRIFGICHANRNQ